MNLNEFQMTNKSSDARVVFYKHIRSGYEIAEKKMSIQTGIDEINVLKDLNSNCFPQLIDYEINAEAAILYMNKIEGVTFSQAHGSPQLMQHIINHIEIVFFNSIQCLKTFHNAGFLHRDVKPDNLMIDLQLNVYLIDFSVAVAKSAHNLRSSGVGTFDFMSPETVFKPEDVDDASDYYGLGKSLMTLIDKDKGLISVFTLERITGLCEIQNKKRKKNIERIEF